MANLTKSRRKSMMATVYRLQSIPEDVDVYRIAVLGAKGVGKTSLISRYIYGKFYSNCFEMIKDLHKGLHVLKGKIFEMDILDGSGKDASPDARKLAIANSHAFILVYSLGDIRSCQEILELQEDIKKYKGKHSDVPMVIVGNKLDLFGEYERKRSTSIDIFLFNGIAHIESSAKEDKNVSAIFDKLLHQIPTNSSSSEPQRRSLPAIVPSTSRGSSYSCISS